MPRLFTGIEIPVEIQEQLAAIKGPVPGARWIEPADLHLTLRFAGDIDNRTAQDFADHLAAIDIDAFELRLEGLHVFGGNDPSSIWIGVAPSPALETLARANERAARAAGLPPVSRGFKPHVTVARLKHARIDALTRLLQRHGGLKCEPFLVSRFVLFSSRPSKGGGPYIVEEAFPTRGGVHGAWSDQEIGW